MLSAVRLELGGKRHDFESCVLSSLAGMWQRMFSVPIKLQAARWGAGI